MAGRQKLRQPRSLRNPYWVRLDHFPARLMVYPCLQILNQGPIAPDIQGLRSVTNGEDRLVKIECVLQQQLVNRGSRAIDLATLWNRIFAISLWVYVEAAARQHYPADPCQKRCNPFLRLMKGDDDRCSPDCFEGCQVSRQRPLIVINARCRWAREWQFESSS